MQYYLQHSAGLGDLVIDALASDLPRPRLVFADDSSVVVATSAAVNQVAGLPYVKNVFQVLDTVPRGSVAGSTDQLVRHIRKRSLLRDQRRGAPFRTMTAIDGKLVGLPRDTRARLESVIAEQTGGRFTARGGSVVEYWVVGRRDLDVMMLCLRLTGRSKSSETRGSLASDLTTLLVKASSPCADDVFLDPFGGSGAIVASRLDSPVRSVTYSDVRLAELRTQLPPRLVQSRKVRLLDEDAAELPSVPTGSITSVVTDPPWGEHETLAVLYETFARRMLAGLDRVLDPRAGRLVLLLSRWAAEPVAALWERADLRIDAAHNILVNGHPATVLVGGRRS
ncbi:MAG: hypothetical protein ACRDSL_17545 [Pseudonocardiaceae bacterium]